MSGVRPRSNGRTSLNGYGRILVTGASGSVGDAVCRRLLREGVGIRGMSRDPSRLEEIAAAGAQVARADLTDPATLPAAVRGCDVVLHFAGTVRDPQPWSVYEAVNVTGTRNLARVALESGVAFFLHTSTAWVYGLEAGPGTDEDCPHRYSDDPYCDTKIRGELTVRRLVADAGLPAVIVQPGQVYGPRMRHWTLRPLEMMQKGVFFLPDRGRGRLHPIFIDELVDGVLAALRRGGFGERYLLCGPEPVLTGEFFGAYARLLGKDEVRSAPGSIMEAAAALANRVAGALGLGVPVTRAEVRALRLRASYDTRKAREELEFHPRIDLHEGMRQVARWLEDGRGPPRDPDR